MTQSINLVKWVEFCQIKDMTDWPIPTKGASHFAFANFQLFDNVNGTIFCIVNTIDLADVRM